MRDAFTYMFKDPGFKIKALVYFLICFFATGMSVLSKSIDKSDNLTSYLTSNPTIFLVLIALAVLAFLFTIVQNGYFINCISAVTKQDNNIILPFLNIKNSFKTGVKFFVASSLIGLAFVAIYFILSTISSLLNISIIIKIIAVLAVCFYTLITPCLQWMFANNNNDILTFFRLKTVFSLLSKNAKKYFITILLIALIMIITLAFKALPPVFFIISVVIETYVMFVNSYLIAKAIKTEVV